MKSFFEHRQHSLALPMLRSDSAEWADSTAPSARTGCWLFSTYRQLHPVSRQTLRGIAEQFQHWLEAWSGKRNIPILDAPQGRHRRALRPISTQKK
jgi:hypothetical protein